MMTLLRGYRQNLPGLEKYFSRFKFFLRLPIEGRYLGPDL